MRLRLLLSIPFSVANPAAILAKPSGKIMLSRLKSKLISPERSVQIFTSWSVSIFPSFFKNSIYPSPILSVWTYKTFYEYPL